MDLLKNVLELVEFIFIITYSFLKHLSTIGICMEHMFSLHILNIHRPTWSMSYTWKHIKRVSYIYIYIFVFPFIVIDLSIPRTPL